MIKDRLYDRAYQRTQRIKPLVMNPMMIGHPIKELSQSSKGLEAFTYTFFVQYLDQHAFMQIFNRTSSAWHWSENGLPQSKLDACINTYFLFQHSIDDGGKLLKLLENLIVFHFIRASAR